MKKGKEEKTEEENKPSCPHGHVFGGSYDKYRKCDDCKLREECHEWKNKPWIFTCHKNPIKNDCTKCVDFEGCTDYQHAYSRIPHYVIDFFLWRISASSAKIFLYLNRRAYFDKKRNYGKCFLTYTEIADATGVKASNMLKYMKELQQHGLIKFTWQRRNTQSEGYSTIHEFTIVPLRRLEGMKLD